MGFDDGHGRRDFKGGRDVNRSTLAVVARRAARERLVPVWDLPPPCRTGRFDGQFCDDDTHDNEAAHNALVNRLDTPLSCANKGNRPAFCPGQTATRGQAIYVLTRSQGIPRRGHRNAFRDDNGHPYEDYFDAARAFGVIRGYDDDREVRASIDADRTMVAVMLGRLFDLPAADRDYFSDDNDDPMEVWHNKVAAAGLFAGYDNGRGGRAFRGGEKATRSTLATVALRAKEARLVPVWDQ